MDDFLYLLQKGGRDKKILGAKGNEGTAQKIIKWVVIILKFVLIIVVIYTIYIILFKGYPRIFINLFLFKFSNKEKLDNFIKENNLLITHMKFLSAKHPTCLPPYAMYQMIYGPTNLSAKVNEFEQLKDKYYAKHKYDDKYNNAFKEFFLFYNKVNKKNSEDIWFKTNKIKVHYADFYESLLTYRIFLGEITVNNTERGGKKGDDELLYQLYKGEKDKGFQTHKGILAIHNNLISMGKELEAMNKQLSKKPVIPHVVIPESKKQAINVVKDITKNAKMLEAGTLYNLPYSDMTDHGWIIAEYLTNLSQGSQYSSFASDMPAYTNQEQNKLIYYINLPRDQKAVAEKRVMAANKEFFEYIKKRPIFTHIYFSKAVSNKAELYDQVMEAYKLLAECTTGGARATFDANSMKTRVANLQKNAYVLKRFITTVSFLHLFINVYQHNMTLMYEKQIMSDKRFFRELWLPFVDDIVKNRIGNYFKRTFSSQGMGGSYKKFNIWYKQLGKDLNRMIKATFKAFFTSTPVEKPKETETDDGQKSE
jgi:hypothetical protein